MQSFTSVPVKLSSEESLTSLLDSLPQNSTVDSLPQISTSESAKQISTSDSAPQISTFESLPQISTFDWELTISDWSDSAISVGSDSAICNVSADDLTVSMVSVLDGETTGVTEGLLSVLKHELNFKMTNNLFHFQMLSTYFNCGQIIMNTLGNLR